METASGRRVRSGKEYDHLFPLPNGKNTNIRKSADVSDTIRFIQRIVPLTLSDTKKIAALKKGRSLYETCSNYWHFLYEHVPYKKDEEGVEQVRRPARTWWDRMVREKEHEAGVDCDCYTTFLSSMLMNAGIPHKYRITKYPKPAGETPRWQHIYVIVPKDGKLNYDLSARDDYIVMDCVKHRFDDEQPYLERKDYNMKLEYLNGLEEEQEYVTPSNADARDMAAIYDEDDLGKIGQWAQKAVKKVEKTAGKVVHTIAKVAVSPIRNALLVAMKENLFNIGKRLRYAYLSEEQALKKNMNPKALKTLRNIKNKIEDIFQAAGGEKKNFQAAVLKGKGNKDNAVQLAGLNGFGEVYADEDEYNILQGNYSSVQGLGTLGVIGEATVTTILTTIGGLLSQVKGLFPSGSSAEKDMANSTSPADSDTSILTTSTTGDEDSNTTNSALPSTTVRSKPGRNRTAADADTGQDSASLAPQTAQEPVGIIGYVKENTLVATGIVAAAGITTYYLLKRKNGEKRTPARSLSGLDRGRRNKKKKKSKSKKSFKAVTI